MIDDKFYTRTQINNLKSLLEIKQINDLILNHNVFDDVLLSKEIISISVLNNAQSSDISFFDNIKYKNDFIASQAGFCIAKPAYSEVAPSTMCVIASNDPYRLYAIIASYLYQDHTLSVSLEDAYYQDAYGGKIHKNAVLEKNVRTALGVVIEAGCHIGMNTVIQANTFVGVGCHIGRNCIIESNVSITHALIGDNVCILSGARIGQDGFGFAMGGTHQKVPQLGRVIIQDSVSIGANCCVDRGTINDTIIGQGTCIDNMVQIAHNVITGLNCVIAGNTSIAGSVTLGNYVICGGHACIAGHLTINDYARISGGSAVMRDVNQNKTVAGYPAFDIKSFFKSVAALKKLTNKD